MQDFSVGQVGHSVSPIAGGPGSILIKELDST